MSTRRAIVRMIQGGNALSTQSWNSTKTSDIFFGTPQVKFNNVMAQLMSYSTMVVSQNGKDMIQFKPDTWYDMKEVLRVLVLLRKIPSEKLS